MKNKQLGFEIVNDHTRLINSNNVEIPVLVEAKLR